MYIHCIDRYSKQPHVVLEPGKGLQKLLVHNRSSLALSVTFIQLGSQVTQIFSKVLIFRNMRPSMQCAVWKELDGRLALVEDSRACHEGCMMVDTVEFLCPCFGKAMKKP